MPLAFSAPNFSATWRRKSNWYQRQSCRRSLQAKRTVETTSRTPTAARTGRSFFGNGESDLFSMSDPRGQLRPRLPRPVEVPVRPAQERADDRQQEHREEDREKDRDLAAPIPGEPHAGGSRRAPVEPRPDREETDEQ